MSSHRIRPTAVVAALTTLLVMVGAASAYGAWNIGGTGNGTTSAASLAAPTVTATRSTSSPSSAINVSWTTPTQPAAVTYTVTRNGTSFTCANPCTDSGLAAGTSYTYVVTATRSNWTVTGTATASTQAAVVPTLTTSAALVKTGANVTFTATLTGSPTPTGTVTFLDGTNTIACTGGAARPVSSGVATCQTSFATAVTRSIAAVYSGDATWPTTTSAVLSERVVNSAVVGIGFTGVTVNGNSASPTCTGTLGAASYVCTVSGGNNAVLAADVRFVNSSNAPAAYSSDAVTGSSKVETKNTTTNGTVNYAAAGTGTPRLSGTKSGNDFVYITVTFTDGLNTFTAQLKMD